MGKFFANQKQDEAGVVGITLQKLLIFFMVLDVVALVIGMGFFGCLMSLLFHFAVFMGVYRRRTCVLLIYVVLNVIGFVLVAFLLLLVASSMMYVDNNDSYESSSSMEGTAPAHRNYSAYSPQGVHTYLRSSFLNNFHPTPHNNTHAASSSSSDSSSSSSEGTNIWTSSDSYEYSDDIFLISLIALLFTVVLLYCKILSVVLAHRMRKILLAGPTLPTAQPTTQEANVNDYNESDTTPFLQQQQEEPFFTQPGFLPYHPMQPFYPGQGPQAMMPPPFMYGQHPVFYTFAPMQQQPSDEKLEKL